MSLFRNLKLPFSRNVRSRGRRCARRLRPEFAHAFEHLEPRRLLAISAEVLRDINLTSNFGKNSNVEEMVRYGSAIISHGDDGVHGAELWVTEGTKESTRLLVDLMPGPGSSSPAQFEIFNGKLYFVADDGSSGREIWETNGTAEGTRRITNFSNAAANPSDLTIHSDQLFFSAQEDSLGRELWKSDGTEVGTALVANIASSATSSDPMWLTSWNNRLYFTASTLDHGRELWVTDGSSQGTSRVHDISIGVPSSEPQQLTAYDGALYFTADDGIHGRELWRTGVAGTQLFKDFRPGVESGVTSNLMVAADHLFFPASDGVNGTELWKTDGTMPGTSLLHEFVGPQGSRPKLLAVYHGRLFFSPQRDSSNPGAIYSTDGTPQGTQLAVVPMSQYFDREIAAARVLGESLYFVAQNSQRVTLWRSDGTEAGSEILGDTTADLDNAVLLPSGDLVFSGATPDQAGELWRSNGSLDGTEIVLNLGTRTGSSSPTQFVEANNLVYFVADDRYHGRELWRTDGTTEGTLLVKDIAPGRFASSPDNLTNLNGTLFFTAETQYGKRLLWRTDGTADGTVVIADLYVHEHAEIFHSEGDLYFSASSTFESPWQLYKSDGTPDGTILLAQAEGTPITSVDVNNAVSYKGDVYFTGYQLSQFGNSIQHIFKTDGTELGTRIVSESRHVSSKMVVFEENLYFLQGGDQSRYGLWRTDGTETGTVHVKKFFLTPHYLQVVNGQLLFVAGDDGHNQRFWTSDGSTAGTRPVPNSPAFSNPNYPIEWKDAIYFLVWKNKDALGELWRTDGTANGTFRIFETNYLLHESGPAPQPAGDYLYFDHDDGVHGLELWRTDGTAQGTHFFLDLLPGSRGNRVHYVTPLNDALLMSAGDHLSGGVELWSVRSTASSVTISHAVSTGGGKTTSGLVVSRNQADGNEVTHVKITNITHGSLFLNDGVTPVADGDFVSFDEAKLGLKFTPTAGFSGTATFGVQASTSDDDEGLGGDVVTAKVFVVPVFTNANDTLYLIANTNQTEVEVYDLDPFMFAVPPLLSWPVDLPDTLLLNTLGGDDQIFVQLPAGMNGPSGGIHFDTGAGTNLLTVRGGNVHIDSTSTGGDLVTIVTAGAQLTTSRLDQLRLALQGTDTKVTLLPGGGVSVLDDLELSLGTTLDVTNNSLVLHSTETNKDGRYADLRAKIQSAQNGLDPNLITNWNGTGLTSSTAHTTNVATGFDLVSLGLIRNSDLDITTGIPGSSYTSFGGEPVGPHDLLLKYTYIGDANLNGVVSFDDYIGMDNAFFELIPNLGWATGDTNSDNTINFDDYSKVDQAFFFQGAPLAGALGATAGLPGSADLARGSTDFSLAQAFTPGSALPSIPFPKNPLRVNAPPDLIGSPAPIASSEQELESAPNLTSQASETLSDARLATSRRTDTRDLWDTALLDLLR